jgi:hypothetical protein
VTIYHLFPGTTPLVQAYDKGGPVIVATTFKVTAPVWITQLRYLSGHGADYDTTPRIGSIWWLSAAGNNLGKVVADVTIPAPSGPDQWTAVTLAQPFVPTVGQFYKVAIQYPNGGYPATTRYFDNGDGNGDFVYGPVVVPVSPSLPGNMQGTFKYTPYTSDNTDGTFNSASYYADVTITDVDPTNVENVFAADGTAYRASFLANDILTTTVPTL